MFERAVSTEEEIENLEKEIDETREAIEDLKEERLAVMFSGKFENKDYVENLSKEVVEKKMRQSEIER